MEIQELLKRLDTHRGSFPNDLVSEIISRQEEAIPILLATLENVEKNPDPWLADQFRMGHVYAMYLLALFREVRAYPLLVRIFSRPGEFPFELAGDVVTQDLGQILASVSNGDTGGITALIENEQANEWVRSAAMGSMVSLVDTGQRSRDEVVSYFLELFHKLERKPGAQWDSLAYVCADLWPQEVIEELRQAYEDGLVDPGGIDWHDIEEAVALGEEGSKHRRQQRAPLITDLAKAMSWMQCFHDPEKYREPKEMEIDSEEDMLAVSPDQFTIPPVRRTTPKVGRNEPCPCGSGKKYKKCCGAH